MLGSRKDPIPCVLLDAYRKRLLASKAQFDAVLVFKAAAEYCGIPVADPEACVIRIDKYYQKRNQETSQPQKPPKRKTMGTAFNDWISELGLEEILLSCCQDYFEARRIYNEVDFEDAYQFANFRMTEKAQQALYDLEIVMYGMGGHYKDDKRAAATPENTKVHKLDTEEGRRSAREAMKRLGFLKNG